MTRWPELEYQPTMPVIIRRAASLFGDKDYVVVPDRRLTFRDVEAASRRLAKQLLAAGVTKGTRVGIHLPSGPEWVVAFVAVTRIGALAMPFSTLYRPFELQTAIRVGDVSVLLSAPTMFGKDHEAFLEDAVPELSTSAPGRLRAPKVPHLRSIRLLGRSSKAWAESFDVSAEGAEDTIDGVDDALLEAVEAEVSPADPLTVVFTSGTTADPKAVVHTQGGVLRKTSPVADAALDAMYGGRVLSLMPFFWIGGMQEVLAAPQSGATLVTLERPDPAVALELAKREQVTSIKEVILAFHSIFEGTDLKSLIPTLQPLPVRDWVGGPSSKGDKAMGIGMTETFGPWANVKGIDCLIVDPETGQVCDEGEIGEFLVRGYGVMQGIYKREREEVFTEDGYYPTGDLGYTEKGKFYFGTRVKDMIKNKGANVAPAEVEAVLNAFPGVRLSFVAGLPHETFGQEVVAAVVPDEDQTIDLDLLLAECRRMLSSYKVPTMIELLDQDSIPRLPSSKPDRRAIIAILEDRRSERTTQRESSPAASASVSHART
jgi:acyl-CoA synthetase (AMP-forming)/AMP-acid ligase II